VALPVGLNPAPSDGLPEPASLVGRRELRRLGVEAEMPKIRGWHGDRRDGVLLDPGLNHG
jgi:hypothetical protein